MTGMLVIYILFIERNSPYFIKAKSNKEKISYIFTSSGALVALHCFKQRILPARFTDSLCSDCHLHVLVNKAEHDGAISEEKFLKSFYKVKIAIDPREQDLSPLLDPAKPYISSHEHNNTI